jgi:endoglucanase
MISNGETSSNQVNAVDGRDGYWYTFADKDGTTLAPPPGRDGGTFAMERGGARGTNFAARMFGVIANAEIAYAGMGMNFVDPKSPYDARIYNGLQFWARKGSGSSGHVRLKVPDRNTDPDGRECTECFNDFGANLELSEQWQEFSIPFSIMKQLPGWGAPHPSNIDTRHLYGLQFQVTEHGPFDIWVDEIAFTNCR